MAITKAPKRREGPSGTATAAVEAPSEAEIMAVINRGGSVSSDKQPASEGDRLRGFELRLYQSMIEEIEASRNQTRKGKKPSRNAWITAAIQEKLEREK